MGKPCSKKNETNSNNAFSLNELAGPIFNERGKDYDLRSSFGNLPLRKLRTSIQGRIQDFS